MMKPNRTLKVAAIAAMLFSLTAISMPQIREAIKILGVGAVVQKFGPDMNKALNKLVKHTDSRDSWTKVVPILTVGIGKSNAIGAAQVKGTRAQVEKVQAVAAPETELFGKEIRIRAMIPVSDKNVGSKIQPVTGVGVSGIVDLKL
jgi:hypothetical protein